MTAEERAATPAVYVSSKRNLLFAGILGLLLVAALVAGRYWLYSAGSSKQIDSIAVLPFVNEGGNPDLEYLSDGMTETLISSLSELPNMSVKARSSVFRYKNQNAEPRTVGKELNVQAILSGRVVQRGDDVVLYLELVDTATENVIFKANYDRPLANLVALQNAIAHDVSNKLRAKLTAAEQQQVETSGTQNAEAYQLYLKGRFHWNKRRPEEHTKAIGYFEQAIALDPNYALAYSGIADCYAVDSSPVKGQEQQAKLQAAALKAMELDPSVGESHAALANFYWRNFDWPAAEQEFVRAIELSPNYATAHQWYGELLSRLGRHEQAVAEMARARDLDPLSLVINSDSVYVLIHARRYQEAIEQGKKTLELDMRWRNAWSMLVFAYEMNGMFEEALNETEKGLEYADMPADIKASTRKKISEAREAFRRSGPPGYWRSLLESEKADYVSGGGKNPSFIGMLHALLGEKDEAFRWLERGIDEKDNLADLYKVDPALDGLHSDPRWPALLKRINMTP